MIVPAHPLAAHKDSPFMHKVDSRIPGFYRLSLRARRQELQERAGLSQEDLDTLAAGGLDLAAADRVVENAVGLYTLPLGQRKPVKAWQA